MVMVQQNMIGRKTGKGDIWILYGSQTGTGEDLAERVGREAIRRGFDPFVSSMNSFDFSKLPTTKILVFIASTTGQGDEPSNMKTFWKSLLKRSISHDFLSQVSFTVLGLGDSSYVKFNFVAKKLFRRVSQLGATPLTKLFLADDQHELGPDAAIDEWLPTLWTQLDPSANLDLYPTLLKPKFRIVRAGVPEYKDLVGGPGHGARGKQTVWKCPLIDNKRVTANDHFQDVRLVCVDISDTGLTYIPGDVLVVHPSNSDDNVNDFFNLFPELNSKRDDEFVLSGNWAWSKIPSELLELCPLPWTWTTVVRNYFDIQAIPKRYFFEVLSQLTTSELEQEKLIEFSSAAGQQDLYTYCNRPKRNILEVLADFPFAVPNIPTEYLFDLIPPIKPRSFSIASSMAALGNQLQILVGVVNYQTKLKKRRLGLCSNWLANLVPGIHELPISIQPGSFQFPQLGSEKPIIMVGPGTGCAPFRSFISERAGSNTKLMFFFGCRFHNKDFYFEDELTALQGQNQLDLYTAFSRETPEAGRTYVQHKIESAGTAIWNFVNNCGGRIYVAGNAKRMPIDVSEAFVSVFKQNGCSDAESYMKQLINSGRYQTEVW